VIRQILTHLLLGPETDSVEDTHDWLVFAAGLADAPAPIEANYYTNDEEFRSEVDDWIGRVIEAFCEQQRATEMFVKFKKESEVTHG
jgi:hypothetical protein